MKFKYIFLLMVLAALSLNAEPKKLNATNTQWYTIQGGYSEEYPVNGNWQLTEFKVPIIIPRYKGNPPQLQNFEIHHKAFPNMMDVAIGPPSEGIYRPDEKEQTRYVEFINEKAFQTDNNLEYAVPLDGEWAIDKKFRTKDYLFQMTTGTENWLEVIAGNKLLASGKGKVVLAGDIFPEKGVAIIRVSSIDTNNKGLINVKIYKAYEKVIVDPFHKALNEKWYSPEKSKTLNWSTVTNAALRKSPWFPEHTPSLYKRMYKCNTLDAAKNVYYSSRGSITHMWINGKQVDINKSRIPEGYFTVGDNEVLYYSSNTFKGLGQNLEFLSIRPYWVKTEVEATVKSVLTAMLRGVSAKVYVNGKYAGLLNKEKNDEFFGYGLFKDGKNEVALCILQNNPKTFLEELIITEADETKALILPWTSKSKELSARSPGTLSSYGGYYLQYRPGNGAFEAKFSSKAKQDLELIFDSGKRFPTWMFRKDLFVPTEILLNGESIPRTGNSFILPALKLKGENTISFNYLHGQLPEPLLYLSSKARPTGFFRFKQISRFGRERLKPTLYFTGEKLSYLVDADFSAFEKVEAVIGSQKFEIKKDSSKEFSFELKSAGRQELKFNVSSQGKILTIPGETYYVADFPKDSKKWLGENKTVSEILIGSDAFYNSESTLFPEFHQKEWMLRERKSDSSSIEFGPLAGWKDKQKFSIFDSFPNSEVVFEKFGRRMETYMKLRSRSYPVDYVYEKKVNVKELWSSAAVVFQYLRWLESQKVKVDWSKETLDEYVESYVEGMKAKSEEYLKFRVDSISKVIKILALNAAPGSSFKEISK